jgi:hypothetical protein
MYPLGFTTDGVNFGPLVWSLERFELPELNALDGSFKKSFIELNADDAEPIGSFRKPETPGIEVAVEANDDNPLIPPASPDNAVKGEPEAIPPVIILFAPETTPTTEAAVPASLFAVLRALLATLATAPIVSVTVDIADVAWFAALCMLDIAEKWLREDGSKFAIVDAIPVSLYVDFVGTNTENVK